MSTTRRIELISALLAVLLAGVVALVVAPLPPLEEWTYPRAGWARGIEFGVLVFILWMAFSTVGFMRAKISVGIDGVSSERAELIDLSTSGTRDVRDATTSLADNVQRLAGQVEILLAMQRQTTRRIDQMYQGNTAATGAAILRVQPEEDGESAPLGPLGDSE